MSKKINDIEIFLLLNDEGKAINCSFYGSSLNFYESREFCLNELAGFKQEEIDSGRSSNPVIISLSLSNNLPETLNGLNVILSLGGLLIEDASEIEAAMSKLFIFAFNSRK